MNALIVVIMVVVNIWLWVLLPTLMLPESMLWGWSLVAVVLVTTSYWSVLHEAFHGNLFPSCRMNYLIGRLLSVLLICSFRTLRFGHLMHHRYNRSLLDRTEVVSQRQLRQTGPVLFYYARLTFGLYAALVFGAWAAFLPRFIGTRVVNALFAEVGEDGLTMRVAAQQQLLSRAGLSEIRVDSALSLLLTIIGFYLYGSYWWMLALALLGRGFMISFFDNVYHYGTPLNDKWFANNLSLPPFLARAILNFNLHGVHHARPSLPWSALPAEMLRSGATYHFGFFGNSLRQLEGPIVEESLPASRAGYR